MYKVMLADDEPIMRKALLTFIDWEAAGCEVIYTAVNGQDIMEHIEDMEPDILVTDIKMPGPDGIAVAKYIWERQLPVKVIILTAYADFSYAQAAVKYGVMDYVTKTGAFEELSEALGKCIENIERERRQQQPGEEDAVMENFFRAVINGSLFDAGEILAKAGQMALDINGYAVLLVQFRMLEETDDQTRQKIHKSLRNFFRMVFGMQMIYGLFMKRDLFCVIIRQEEEGTGQLEDSCTEIIDMMDNFMKLNVFVGVSGKSEDLTELREYYGQAGEALKRTIAEGRTKAAFYRQETKFRKDKLIADCIGMIEERFLEPLSVADICRELGTSISYLSRIFKEATGDTVIHTINRRKIEKAKEYLEQTDMKIYEIADALGFENTTYFSHFFKKHTGHSPKEYR